jgi:hypothetical protein
MYRKTKEKKTVAMSYALGTRMTLCCTTPMFLTALSDFELSKIGIGSHYVFVRSFRSSLKLRLRSIHGLCMR